MPIKIHDKQYVTVAERLEELSKWADDNKQAYSIETEVLQHVPVVVIKATVTINEDCYTGISAANPAKAIEKQSPYEVAETSAVGRALGFAGFGLADGVASADEIVNASEEPEVINRFKR
jgi:non-ribosomal peptide synthetase component E (peptide arylation enzyme)